MHVYGRVISVMMNGWGGGGGGGGEGSDEAAESPGGGGCNCDVSSLLSYHLMCQHVCFPSGKCYYSVFLSCRESTSSNVQSQVTILKIRC